MILIIDEERARMAIHVDILKEFGYEVKNIVDVDDAWDFIAKNEKSIDVIILDIMMPYGKLFDKDETNEGLHTGYKFYHKMRAKYGYDMHVIIYTALNNNEILKRLREEKNCHVFQKLDAPITAIAEKIREIKNK